MRWAPIFLLLFSCATSLRIPPSQDAADQRELSLLDDLGPDPGDLARPPADLGAVDLGGADLSMPAGCLTMVVVNEVQTSGASASDEWVELYNPCPSSVSLSGCKLTYRSATNSGAADTATFATLSQTIASHGYFLVANSGYSAAAVADVKPFAGGGMADTGGGVGLRCGAAGTLIDSMGWGSANNPFVETSAALIPGVAGKSMARTPDGADTNNNSNDFKVAATPTPRAMN